MTPNEHDAGAIRAAIVRAQELMRQGSLDAADAVLGQALGKIPDDPDVLYLRGVIANRRRDHVTAITVLRQSVAARPASARAWLALGNAYAQSGQPAPALDAYREVLAREPEWPDAHYNRGLILKRQGDFAGAMHAFYSAWVLDPAQRDGGKQCVDTTGAWVRAGGTALEIAPV
jgi:Flp pilus assembly protein TadD